MGSRRDQVNGVSDHASRILAQIGAGVHTIFW